MSFLLVPILMIVVVSFIDYNDEGLIFSKA